MTHELLSKALKYSGAAKIQVALTETENTLQLSISDNGKGAAKVPTLRSVEDRLQRINGRLQINTKERNGTIIRIFIPF